MYFQPVDTNNHGHEALLLLYACMWTPVSMQVICIVAKFLPVLVIKPMGREWPVFGSPSSLVTERAVVLGCPLPSSQVSATIEY